MADRTLKIKFEGDTSDLDTSLDATGSRLSGIASSVSSLGKSFAAGIIIEGAQEIAQSFNQIVGDLATGDLEGAMGRVKEIGDNIAKTWDTVSAALNTLTGGAFGEFIGKLQEFADVIGPKVAPLIDAFAEAFSALQPILQTVMEWLKPIIDILSFTLSTGLGFALDAITGVLETIAALLKGDFKAAFEGVFNGIVEIVKGALNILIDLWNAIDFGIPPLDIGFPGITIPNPTYGVISGDLLPGWLRDKPTIDILGATNFHIFDGTGDLIPDIPKMAKGGIVRKPTLAMIGEAGPEAVVPLGHGGAGVVVNVYGFVGNAAELGREINRALTAYARRGGRIGAH